VEGGAVFERGGNCCAKEVADFGGFAECGVNDGFAKVELFFDEFVGSFIEREFDSDLPRNSSKTLTVD
jgi:hypothetical protein